MAGTYTNLLYHCVFSTKHRRRIIGREMEKELYSYMGGIARGLGGSSLEINGIEDHVHLLVKLKPYPSISDFHKELKGSSSRWVNANQKISARFGWQVGYSAFTVSESAVPDVRKYIQNQKEHHSKMDFQEELLFLLQRHGVEYDERYLWS